MSWNVNGIRACSGKGLFDFVSKIKPDFVCLQEIKAMKEQCTQIQRSPFLPHEVWHSAERPGYSGVLTMASNENSHGLKWSTTIGMGHPLIDREGRVLITDLGRAFLLNMYFPNGAMSEERHQFKMEFLKKILKFFKKLDREKPLILTGDFNIAHQSIDIHDPIGLEGESGFKPEERAWMNELLGSGFVDTFRDKYPEAKDQYSWWSYLQAARRRNKGWRIDYFIVSERLKKQIKEIKMHQDVMGSDHCPLTFTVEL